MKKTNDAWLVIAVFLKKQGHARLEGEKHLGNVQYCEIIGLKACP